VNIKIGVRDSKNVNHFCPRHVACAATVPCDGNVIRVVSNSGTVYRKIPVLKIGM